MAVDIDPSDNSELIGKAGEKVMVVRQRQDSFNRIELSADGAVNIGTGYTAPTSVATTVDIATEAAARSAADAVRLICTFPASSYGALGDGVTNDTSAIQAAIDAASTFWNTTPGSVLGTTLFDASVAVTLIPGRQYKVSNLILKQGVVLYSPPAGSHPTATLRTIPGSTGFMVSTTAHHVGVVGISFAGDSSSSALGGIFINGSIRSCVMQCVFNQFGDEALKVSATTVVGFFRDVYAESCLMIRTRASQSAVLDFDGTDHVFHNVEATASVTARTAQGWCAAIRINGSNHVSSGIVGETSDTGVLLGSTNSRLSGIRADLNWGNGFEITTGSGILAAAVAVNNGRQTANTYDGFSAGTVGNWLLSGCLSIISGAGSHRFGFSDAQQSDVNKNHYANCRSFGHTTASFSLGASAPAGVTQFPSTMIGRTGATPSVDGTSSIVVTGGATITNFTSGLPGQMITVRLTGDGTSIQHNGATIIGNGNRDITTPTGVQLLVQLLNINGVWYEIGQRFPSQAKPTVTGSRGGNAALASALSALVTLGLITDSSTA